MNGFPNIRKEQLMRPDDIEGLIGWAHDGIVEGMMPGPNGPFVWVKKRPLLFYNRVLSKFERYCVERHLAKEWRVKLKFRLIHLYWEARILWHNLLDILKERR